MANKTLSLIILILITGCVKSNKELIGKYVFHDANRKYITRFYKLKLKSNNRFVIINNPPYGESLRKVRYKGNWTFSNDTLWLNHDYPISDIIDPWYFNFDTSFNKIRFNVDTLGWFIKK